MRGARGRRRRGGLIGLVAAALLAPPASAQISQGVKRPGPIPYVVAFGRRAVKRPKPPAATHAGLAHARPPHAQPASPALPAAQPTAPAAGAAAAVSPAGRPAPVPSPQAAAPSPLLPPPPLTPGPPAVGPPLDAAALPVFVDGLVAQARASDPLVGVAVAVVQNGQVVFEKGYGATGLGAAARPVDPRATLFRLGSVSKVLTWIEVLKQVEAGRLRLDAPVNDALPPALRPPDEGFRRPITLDELMTHTSGFEAREFGRLYRLDDRALVPLDRALVRDRPRRVRSPGELSSYSSYDAALAGALIEHAARAPFDLAMQRDLLGPAHLNSTSFRQPMAAADAPALSAALLARLAAGHVMTARGLRPLPFEVSSLTPALSASSTADDMARLMVILLARGRDPGGGAPVWGEGVARLLESGPVEGWTHGLRRIPLPSGREGLGHEGATLGFRTQMLVAPSLGLGVFVAANSDTGEKLVRTLPAAIASRLAAPAGAAAPPSAGVDPAALRGRAQGLYLSTRRAYHGLEGFVDRLTRLYRVRVGPDGQVVASGLRGARLFRATADPDLFEAAGGTERLRFRGRGGPATAFVDPQGVGAAERVGWLQDPATLACAAALATLAALLTLAGPFVRGREGKHTPAQAGGAGLQAACAVLWLGAVAAFGVFELRAADPVRLYAAWPDPWLVGASCAALAVALGTLGQLASLPAVLSDARRVQGWTGWRKLRHSLTVTCFLVASVVLAAWGALEPWSS